MRISSALLQIHSMAPPSCGVWLPENVEQEMVVRDEVDRRIALLERHRPEPAAAREPVIREALRQAHAELRLLAANTSEPELRQRALRACTALTPALADPSLAVNRDLPPVQLAPRELDVLAWVALGYTNGEVASEMGIAVETVKSYLRSAMRKLHARTRTQAVVAARRAGLLP